MQQPVLSIDVAKGKSVAAAFSAYHSIVRKPFTFSHTPQGVSALLPLLDELEHMTNQRPYVVLEATGNYSKPLVSYFTSMGYPVVVLNPLLTHQLKKKATRKVKTDPIDALRIAQTFYLENSYRISLYGDVQRHFRSVLDLLFPGYERIFHNICNPTSLELLSQYPTPKDVLEADQDHMLSILLHNRRGRIWNESKLALINTIAHESFPDSEATVSHQIAIRNYISLLRTYRVTIDDIKQHMLQLVSSRPEHALLLSIPGVGPLTPATIQSEIGDIKRFPSVKQLTAFAGLDSSVYESGTFMSNKNHISKRGSSYLRTALYQATVASISKQVNGPRNEILSSYYQLKRAQGKPPKVAIVATSNKLLRIIYGVLSSQIPFRKD